VRLGKVGIWLGHCALSSLGPSITSPAGCRAPGGRPGIGCSATSGLLSAFWSASPRMWRTLASVRSWSASGICARMYGWSSYPGDIGRGKQWGFVDESPVLAMMAGGMAIKRKAYREFVETGLATGDEEFQRASRASARAYGRGSPAGPKGSADRAPPGGTTGGGRRGMEGACTWQTRSLNVNSRADPFPSLLQLSTFQNLPTQHFDPFPAV